jgi:hypothetical protein
MAQNGNVFAIRRSVALMCVLFAAMAALYVSFPFQPKVAILEPQNPSYPERKSFSELTLFLFGSGVALFVGLLAWSDQIKGMDKDTRDLENNFLTVTKLDKKQFMSVVKAATPQEELKALTVVWRSNLLHSPNYVLLLGIFKTWYKDWEHLQSVGTYKYNFTVALTISFFLSGILSLHSNPNRFLAFWNLFVREELVILMCPVLIMSILMGMMIYSSSKEKTLRDLLIQISDMV